MDAPKRLRNFHHRMVDGQAVQVDGPAKFILVRATAGRVRLLIEAEESVKIDCKEGMPDASR